MILWCDLETTGLEPKTGSILEVALVMTDDSLVEIGEPFVSIVAPLAGRGIEVMDDYVVEMHSKNGLLDQLFEKTWRGPRLRDGIDMPFTVENQMHEWFAYVVRIATGENLATEDLKKLARKTPFAGSSIHFDKSWLHEHMPSFETRFSHRVIDVSSNNEQALRWREDVYRQRPGLGPDGKPAFVAHRALDDIRASIEVAKFYRQTLFLKMEIEPQSTIQAEVGGAS